MNKAVTEEYSGGSGLAKYGGQKWRATVTFQVGIRKNKQQQGREANGVGDNC